ncbi:L,D-transpeptidase catalytic domain [Raineyella antarctica]|uniref:L,D-transpeptidase catalytic domain n=1 Tax=Raineyella antarctica TaxID=1577474 RepID=A0A1G6GYD0_9ACTN|nr:L,D-transpeptidase family protein [Raineyella antarctica]SDB86923.1 L,D-transpeptidase catalytic domain [Raineyella antarctica]
MRLRRSAVLASCAAIVTLAVGGCAPKTTQAVPAERTSEAPAAVAFATPSVSPSASPTPELSREPMKLVAFSPTPKPTPKSTPTPSATPSAEATMDATVNADAAAAKAAEDKKKADAAKKAEAAKKAQATKTAEPTKTEAAQPATDPRCGYGEVMCISKAANKLYFMQDGKIVSTMDVRFGKESDPERRTREGNFLVFRKEVDWTSNLFGSQMPYAMFFSGGQAVHFSSDFAARGYAGNSHGCVNVRDKAALAKMFAEVDVMSTRVVVY